MGILGTSPNPYLGTFPYPLHYYLTYALLLDPNTSLILWATVSSIKSLPLPIYFLGSNTLGFSTNVSLIPAVIANLKSVSTFILDTPDILASCNISSGTPLAPGKSAPYLLQISTNSGITVDAPCNTIGVFGIFSLIFYWKIIKKKL